MNHFPIDTIKNDIIESLNTHDWLIIKSSPGSGKTTRVPVFLNEIFQKKIYILEPRRLAAKLAAKYVGKGLNQNEKLVGHIFRFENTTTPNTKIVFLTEGSFLNIIKDNPNLKNTDVVILDEFHERHLNTDMALAFLKEIKRTNSDLKVIIMSATLDSSKLEEYLGQSPKILSLELSKHPVEINSLPNDTLVLKEPLERKVLDAINKSLTVPGHILIFLPGMFEIKSIQEKIQQHYSIEPYILHGDLDPIDFEAENFHDLRLKKIILSTNIAESSVTIPGVRIVIDSGLKREARINPISRLKHIELKKTSQSSAIQRAHRSNREGPGIVFRLFSQFDFETRVKFDQAEIMRADLSDLVLRTQDIFNKQASSLDFFEVIDNKELEKAELFLKQLALITESNQLTLKGSKVSRIPHGPRIASIILAAADAGPQLFKQTLDYIANWQFLGQSDLFKKQIQNLVTVQKENLDISFEKIFLSGHIDQIAKIRNTKELELIHRNGEIYRISKTLAHTIDPDHPLWIILDVDNKNQVSKLLPIEEEWLYDLEYFPIEEEIEFELKDNKIFQLNSTKIGAITLDCSRRSVTKPTKEIIIFLKNELHDWFKNLFNENEFSRFYFLEKYSSQKISSFNFDLWFEQNLEHIYFDGSDFKESLKQNYMYSLFDHLNQDLLFNLEDDLPLTIQFTDRRKSKVIYDPTNGIFVESYIQDFYGLSQLSSILKGKEKLTLRLLGPHKRPIQVTNDLSSFWDKAYKEMYAELKREYPKHYWPQNPKEARPILLLKNVPS